MVQHVRNAFVEDGELDINVGLELAVVIGLFEDASGERSED